MNTPTGENGSTNPGTAHPKVAVIQNGDILNIAATKTAQFQNRRNQNGEMSKSPLTKTALNANLCKMF